MILKCWEIPGAKVPPPNERLLTVILSPEVTDTKQLTLLTSIIPPGSTTGSHKHSCDEFMYVAAGWGELAEQRKTEAFQPDSVLFEPANSVHEVKNTGKESLKLVCIYSPPLKGTGPFEEAQELARQYCKRGSSSARE